MISVSIEVDSWAGNEEYNDTDYTTASLKLSDAIRSFLEAGGSADNLRDDIGAALENAGCS